MLGNIKAVTHGSAFMAVVLCDNWPIPYPKAQLCVGLFPENPMSLLESGQLAFPFSLH
jgi:hypothetical protein